MKIHGVVELSLEAPESLNSIDVYLVTTTLGTHTVMRWNDWTETLVGYNQWGVQVHLPIDHNISRIVVL